MANLDAIFPEEATVTIAAADAAVGTGTTVTAEITNFTESGGEEDIESTPVFGGGNIDKTSPRTQMEVSFDVVLRYHTDGEDTLAWDDYKWGNLTSSTVTSAGSAQAKAIYIEFTDGTLFYTRAYNNAKAVTFEPETSADDMVKGTITFKLSPTTAEGAANFTAITAAASTISWPL